MIDVMVLNYNDYLTTASLVKSMHGYSCVRKILVVDNKSIDGSFEKLLALELPKILVVQSGKNGGYGAGNNFGIRYLYEKYKSEFILLCNPDVVIEEGVCVELENFLRKHHDYAIAAPFMTDVNGKKMDNTAFNLPSKKEYILSLSPFIKNFTRLSNCGLWANKLKGSIIDVGGVSGSLFMMNVDLMMKYGMFDENIFLYCEELVLGKKMTLHGKKIALLPHLAFLHNHSVSISKSYRSLLKRHRLLVKSKSYVIDNYFDVNFFDRILKFFFIIESYIEIFFINLYHKMK